MTPIASLRHTTRYSYSVPVDLGPHVVRLRPTPYCRTLILDYAISASPTDHFVNWLQDPNGNWMARYVFTQPTDTLLIGVQLSVDLTPVNPFDFFVREDAATWPFSYDADLRLELGAYTAGGSADAFAATFANELGSGPTNTVEVLTSLNRRVHEAVGYEIREEPGVQEPEHTLERGTGSCRDSAWLLVQALRQLGFGARFVSGYLIQAPDIVAGPTGVASELHAWAEAYLPGAGWIGLDPTLGVLCSEGHIPLAACAHHHSAAPVAGSHSEASVAMHHEITLEFTPAEG